MRTEDDDEREAEVNSEPRKNTIEELQAAIEQRIVMEKVGIANAQVVFSEIDKVYSLMKRNKPNDRSEQDRCWAIAITDMQRVRAFFNQEVVGHE